MLTLKGKQHHELACATCGAPLHDLKHMPVTEHREVPKPATVRPSRIRVPVKDTAKPKKSYKSDDKKKRLKKKKSFFQKVLSEVIDEIEDIFD